MQKGHLAVGTGGKENEMKKKFLMVLALILPFSINAQEVKDSYYSSYFEKDCKISASIDKGELSILFNVMGEYNSDDVRFMIKGEKINEFINSLEQVKSKYQEWSEIAKTNNVKGMDKYFDVDFPRIDIAWYSSDWWFAFRSRLTPYFKVTDSGKCLVVFNEEVVSSNNKYIDQRYYLVFSSTKEIDELIDKLNPVAIIMKLNQKQDVQDMFH